MQRNSHCWSWACFCLVSAGVLTGDRAQLGCGAGWRWSLEGELPDAPPDPSLHLWKEVKPCWAAVQSTIKTRFPFHPPVFLLAQRCFNSYSIFWKVMDVKTQPVLFLKPLHLMKSDPDAVSVEQPAISDRSNHFSMLVSSLDVWPQLFCASSIFYTCNCSFCVHFW